MIFSLVASCLIAASAVDEAFLKEMGGNVIKPDTVKGLLCVYDGAGAGTEVRNLADFIRTEYCLNTRVIKLENSISVDEIPARMKKDGAGLALFIIDSPKKPSLLVAPEGGWSLVNLSPIRTAADVTRQSNRVHKELRRAFAYAVGGGATEIAGCVMNPVRSAEDLDRLTTDMVSPDALNGLEAYVMKFGLSRFVVTTYRDACEEGWASPPTNDYQKAIWTEFHPKQ